MDINSAIERVNRLKELATSMVGDDGQGNTNAKQIESVLTGISSRIARLSRAKDRVKEKIQNLENSASEAQRLIEATSNIPPELEQAVGSLNQQINAVKSYSNDELDTVIRELEELVPSGLNPNAKEFTPTNQSGGYSYGNRSSKRTKKSKRSRKSKRTKKSKRSRKNN